MVDGVQREYLGLGASKMYPPFGSVARFHRFRSTLMYLHMEVWALNLGKRCK